jgi:hypothetical protein
MVDRLILPEFTFLRPKRYPGLSAARMYLPTLGVLLAIAGIAALFSFGVL